MRKYTNRGKRMVEYDSTRTLGILLRFCEKWMEVLYAMGIYLFILAADKESDARLLVNVHRQ